MVIVMYYFTELFQSIFDILLMLSVPYIEFHSSLRLTTSSIELVFQ